jgi:T5SS/PEP-CTERM-associated repeat protein
MCFSNATVLGQLMFLGQFPGSQGTLTMVNANYRLASFLSIGESADATGAVWMTGGQLTVTNAPIEVGFSGSGQLTVSNGVVSAAQLYVGTSVGSAGTLTMLNSATITLSSNMVIGSTSSNYIFGGGVTGSVFAAGTVWLKGGSLVLTNSQMDIGLDGIGAVTVSNGVILARDARVNATNLGSMTASSAQGNLTVPGGKVTVFNSLILGDCASGGGVGNVFVTGGSVIVTNSGGTGTIDVRDGTLTLSNGLIQADRLVMTNSCGLIANSGGTIIVGTLVLDPNLSATGDGLPNGWKQQYGLNPLSSSGNNGPNGDPDGDGMSNLQEYLAGTDPTNSSSALRITTVVRQGADVLITWQTVGGKNYVLQFVPINTTGFTNVFTDYSPLISMPSGPASTTNYLDVGAATNASARYYRVRLGP